MYVHMYIYIGRKLQGISFIFLKKKILQKKKKKKNFSDVALFATSENSDV
jgi:DNA-directed RNA polymerase delta subunit